MQLHIFGSTNPAGQAFHDCAIQSHPSWAVYAYSRRDTSCTDDSRLIHRADLANPHMFIPAGEPGSSRIWISFAPIWLFSSFLEQLACDYPECLRGLLGLIACSSSSAITKRFAVNRMDRELVARLRHSEQQLIATCRRLDIPCRILRPTLIYGRVGIYGDHNLSQLVHQMRRLPFFLLPLDSGLRQPIHATQLASVALHLVQQLACSISNPSLAECITLGGDTTLNYADMIRSLQHALPFGDPARRCRLLLIPNRLFFLLATPLLLCSPKVFEAVLRIGSNLSGFTPTHQLLGTEPQPFPIAPLA